MENVKTQIKMFKNRLCYLNTKILMVFILSCFVFKYTIAQDYIILNTGKKISCKITKIDSTKFEIKLHKGGRKISTFIKKENVKDYGISVIKSYYTPHVGFSNYTGVIGFEIQKNRFSFNIGFNPFDFDDPELEKKDKYEASIDLLTSIGLKYYLKPNEKSWYFGLCSGVATKSYFYFVDDYLDIYLGPTAGYRWRFKKDWVLNLAAGIGFYIVGDKTYYFETNYGFGNYSFGYETYSGHSGFIPLIECTFGYSFSK